MTLARNEVFMRKTFLHTILALLAIVMITGCSAKFEVNAIDQTINYEKTLLDTASYYGYSTDDIVPQIKSITYDSGNLMDEYDDILRITWLDDNYLELDYPPNNRRLDRFDTSLLEYQEVKKEYISLFESAREKLFKYIDDSSVLKDKDTIKEKILTIELYSCTDPQNIGMFGDNLAFVFYNGAVYLNPDSPNIQYLSEFTILHELFHGLRHFTTNSDSAVYEPRYSCYYFDEAFINILTESCNPAITLPRNVTYEAFSYMPLHPYLYSYIYFFGTDALEAFFYGYDEFFEMNGGNEFRAEHDALSTVLMYIGEQPEATWVYSEILNKMIK